MPFIQFIDYLTLEKKYSPHTIMAYKKDLESFLAFASEGYGYENIKEVNYSIIRSWIISLVDGNSSNRTVNRKISSLKSYYKFLLKTSQIEVNPLAGHKALKTSKKIQIPFSEVEIENVLESLKSEDNFKGVRDKLIVELFYSTGIRRAELVGLKLLDVSAHQKTMKVLGKRNKERIIPLLPSVLTTIKRYLVLRNEQVPSKDNGWFFLSNKGDKIYETLVYRIINTYFSEASEIIITKIVL